MKLFHIILSILSKSFYMLGLMFIRSSVMYKALEIINKGVNIGISGMNLTT